MYERFDDLTRSVVQGGSDFAATREDTIVQTGHLLYGLFGTGANAEIPCLATLPGSAVKIATALAGVLPDGLVRLRNQGATFSDAYASTLEQAVLNARAGGVTTILVSDLLRAVLVTGPNVAMYLLDILGVDRDRLNREWQGSSKQRSGARRFGNPEHVD